MVQFLVESVVFFHYQIALASAHIVIGDIIYRKPLLAHDSQVPQVARVRWGVKRRDFLIILQEVRDHKPRGDVVIRVIWDLLKVIVVPVRDIEVGVDLIIFINWLLQLYGDVINSFAVRSQAESLYLGLNIHELDSLLTVLEGYDTVVVKEYQFLVNHLLIHPLVQKISTGIRSVASEQKFIRYEIINMQRPVNEDCHHILLQNILSRGHRKALDVLKGPG